MSWNISRQGFIRFDDWERRLNLFIESRRDVPFSWGKNDCFMFMADAIQSITGEDIGLRYRGAYFTELGANRILRRESGLFHGGSGLFAHRNIPLIPAKQAARGDAVFVRGNVDAFGIIGLSGDMVLTMTKMGFAEFPLRMAVSAWRI